MKQFIRRFVNQYYPNDLIHICGFTVDEATCIVQYKLSKESDYTEVMEINIWDMFTYLANNKII